MAKKRIIGKFVYFTSRNFFFKKSYCNKLCNGKTWSYFRRILGQKMFKKTKIQNKPKYEVSLLGTTLDIFFLRVKFLIKKSALNPSRGKFFRRCWQKKVWFSSKRDFVNLCFSALSCLDRDYGLCGCALNIFMFSKC